MGSPPGADPGDPGPATVRPAYRAASLSEVLPSVLAALGLPREDRLGLAAGPLAGIRAVAVLLIDGLGAHQLDLAAPYAPALAALCRGAAYRDQLTAGFPSTTPTSLVSVGTGVTPGEHGVLGFFVNIPGTDRVLNHVRWRGDGDSGDPDPRVWQPVPTQFERAGGVAAVVVERSEFHDSGLTAAAYRGAAMIGADDAVALGSRMAAQLRHGPALVYGYYPDVDSAGHAHGVDSPQWRAAVAQADRALAILLEALPTDAAVVVTADHGQVNVPMENRFDIAMDSRLTDGVRLVAGEARVRYLHTYAGATGDVVAAWRGVLGDAAWVANRAEAIEAGWFGPVALAHAARIGDVVAACHGTQVLLDSRTDPQAAARLVAFHGSATAAEMMVPLLVARG